jgi:hypothetical protein
MASNSTHHGDGMHDGWEESPACEESRQDRRARRSQEWKSEADKFKGQLSMPEWMIAVPEKLRCRTPTRCDMSC